MSRVGRLLVPVRRWWGAQVPFAFALLAQCGGEPVRVESGATSRSSVDGGVGRALGFDDEARELLLQLTAVDTSHGHETDALKPVAERLKASGIAAEIVESAPGRGNLVARLKGNGSKKPLLLLAHVDVVPVEGQPWTVPPF